MTRVILTMLAATIFFVAPARASPECPTKAEARAKYPKAHIWRSGPDWCWSNKRGEFRYHKAKPVKTIAEEPPQTWDKSVWYPEAWPAEK